MMYPVVVHSIKTGRISQVVHDYSSETKKTLCGIDAYDPSDNFYVQLSVVPKGTQITCPQCISSVDSSDPSKEE